MTIPFYKLQGAGNDFVVIDNRNLQLPMSEIVKSIPDLCDRRFGIGADGFIALSPSETCNYEIKYFNADGSDAGMCGNGGRCAARLASHLGLDDEHSFEVHGNIYNAVVKQESVILHFPAKPIIQSINDEDFGQIDIINTGTEHICILVTSEKLQNHDHLRNWGRRLRYDSRFSPKGTNVNFYAPLSESEIILVTYERGVEDLTLACGTGSLAAAICSTYSSVNKTSDNSILVKCLGGDLTAHFTRLTDKTNYTNLKLEGPAEIVYTGKIQI
jgi:diaminopimelate epimerase